MDRDRAARHPRAPRAGRPPSSGDAGDHLSGLRQPATGDARHMAVRGKPAVLVSLTVHGVVLAFAARWAVGHAVEPRAPHTARPLAQPPHPVAEAIAVEFFNDASGASVASAVHTASAGDGRA